MFKFIHNLRLKHSPKYRKKVRIEELNEKIENARMHKMGPVEFRAIIDKLKELRDLALYDKVPSPYTGICNNLCILVNGRGPDGGLCVNTVAIVCNFAEGWKHHKGSHTWPVPYWHGSGLWERRNLVMRLDLIDYVLSEMEAAYGQKYADAQQP